MMLREAVLLGLLAAVAAVLTEQPREVRTEPKMVADERLPQGEVVAAVADTSASTGPVAADEEMAVAAEETPAPMMEPKETASSKGTTWTAEAGPSPLTNPITPAAAPELSKMVAVMTELQQQLQQPGRMANASSSQGISKDVDVPKRYDGHVVLRAVPKSEEQIAELRTFFRNSEADVWKFPSRIGEDVLFRVDPHELDWTKSFLNEKGLSYEVQIPDLQRILDSLLPTVRVYPDTFDWTHFHRLDSIYEWMESIARTHSNVATLVRGGLSTEGRHILGVRIAHAPNLPIIFVEGGIHGREWASPAAATFILNQLLTSTNPSVVRLANSFEWHIYPSVNPDAYEYSHTTDRLWRKSRRRTSFRCFGADLNRNFPFNWGTVGVSWNFCSETFPGTRAASEVETRTRLMYLEELLPRMRAFVALHSFGQYLLFPWGHTYSRPSDYNALHAVGMKAAEAFAKSHGNQLQVGSLAETLYPASGSSMDWAHSRGVPFCYTLELRDRGAYGFLLPAEEILPSSEEATEAVFAVANAIL